MNRPTIGVKKKLLFFLFMAEIGFIILASRVFYIQVFKSHELQEMAYGGVIISITTKYFFAVMLIF